MEAGVTAVATANGTAAYFSCWVGKGPSFSFFGHAPSSYVERGTKLDVSTTMVSGCSASRAAGPSASQKKQAHLSPPAKAVLMAQAQE